MPGVPTRILACDRSNPDPRVVDEAAAVLRGGGLVAFPTETVYGLGADATNPAAVGRIFQAKGRPGTNPLIVHGDDVAAVRRAVAAWPPSAEALAARFWPGPLTLILPRSGLVPDAVTAGHATVGVRLPDCEVARRVIRAAGVPIAAPSANRSTGVSPTSAAHVLKDLDGRVDLILDAGPTPVGIESTVLDLTADPPRVLRPGAISAAQLVAVLGVAVAGPGTPTGAGGVFTSPGQMEVHYAPRTPLQLIEPDRVESSPWPSAERLGLIVAGQGVPLDAGRPAVRAVWSDPAEAARELYATLHAWDDLNLRAIYVVLPPDTDAWRAVRDRLWRASRRWARRP